MVRRLHQSAISVNLEASTSFSHLRRRSLFPPWWQVPTGLAKRLAPTMHLVDALTRMQLTASSKAAECVAFSAYNVKMTLLKGPDALAARRAVASKLDHSAITALRRPMHVDKPDWSLMQQLSDAGIGVCPTSGMPVLDPSACAPGLRTAIWRAYCGVASSVNTKQMGQTDEALDELQMRLHEHAAQLREAAPRAKRLASYGTLTKRSRGASPAPSLSDEGTDAGEPARQRKLRPRRTIVESDDELDPVPMGPVAGSDDAECASLRGRSTASALEVFKDGVRVDAANKCDRHGGEPSTSRAAKAAKVQVEDEVDVDDAPDSPSTQRWGGTTHRVTKLAEWHAPPLDAWPWAGLSATAWAAEEPERLDTRPVRVCDETEPPGEAWSCAGEYTDLDAEADDSHMLNVRAGDHMCMCVDGVAANMHSTASDGEGYESDGHAPGLSAMLCGMAKLTDGRVCIAGSYALHHYLREHRGVDEWPSWAPNDIDVFYCSRGGVLDVDGGLHSDELRRRLLDMARCWLMEIGGANELHQRTTTCYPAKLDANAEDEDAVCVAKFAREQLSSLCSRERPRAREYALHGGARTPWRCLGGVAHVRSCPLAGIGFSRALSSLPTRRASSSTSWRLSLCTSLRPAVLSTTLRRAFSPTLTSCRARSRMSVAWARG